MRIDFIPVGLRDLVDIAIVAFLVYQLYRYIRGTIGVQIALALAAIYFIDILVSVAGLRTLAALFGAISDVFVLALIILFAPEIRRLLFLLGRNPIIRRLVPISARQRVVDEVVAATREMSENRIGSLVAFARSTGLRNYAESGTRLNADVERDLLTSIFFPNSPLHDGAVIIQDNRIEAARCILPVSEARRLDPHFGLRHRAAVGLSERTDAFVLVTSEETGQISTAEHGVLHTGLTYDELRDRLAAALIEQRVDTVEVVEVPVEQAENVDNEAPLR